MWFTNRCHLFWQRFVNLTFWKVCLTNSCQTSFWRRFVNFTFWKVRSTNCCQIHFGDDSLTSLVGAPCVEDQRTVLSGEVPTKTGLHVCIMVTHAGVASVLCAFECESLVCLPSVPHLACSYGFWTISQTTIICVLAAEFFISSTLLLMFYLRPVFASQFACACRPLLSFVSSSLSLPLLVLSSSPAPSPPPALLLLLLLLFLLPCLACFCFLLPRLPVAWVEFHFAKAFVSGSRCRLWLILPCSHGTLLQGPRR